MSNCKHCGACDAPDICECCGMCRNCGRAHPAKAVPVYPVPTPWPYRPAPGPPPWWLDPYPYQPTFIWTDHTMSNVVEFSTTLGTNSDMFTIDSEGTSGLLFGATGDCSAHYHEYWTRTLV